jgi:ABC-type branched-subunit amino acid transport system substrate-binding protein
MRGVEKGVRMGVEEAARAAALFGRAVRLVEGPDAAALAGEGRAQALLGGFDAGACQALADTAARLHVVYVDVACDGDALRGRGCRAATFHVAPSAAMLADASAAAGGGRAVAWDERLDRFGADQLNQRFRTRFGAGMDSGAWAGWFAVKVLWESALRARATAPGALARYMGTEGVEFDGHKGRPLSFRAWDRQLRQPLYAGVGDAEPAEVPRTVGGDVTSAQLLDRLGVSRERSECAAGS